MAVIPKAFFPEDPRCSHLTTSVPGTTHRYLRRTPSERQVRTAAASSERISLHHRVTRPQFLCLGKEIGAASRGDVAIFFRKRQPPFEPAVHWVFAEDIDASYQELKSLGANIVDPLERKPWGLRQFTVKDLDGNLFYFHHD